MPFLQLTFDAGAFDSEALEGACFAAGASSVTLMDAGDMPILEPEPGATPLWPKVRVSALFDAQTDREKILDTLRNIFGSLPTGHAFTEIADRVWEREWLANFKPTCFGTRLWICPHKQHVATPNAIVVRLDPGLAFGTGTHPTTAMCLEWLDGADLKGAEVIDYGCGSGILAIAAVKLGATRALAVDHDPQALLATRENAARNGVEQQIATFAPAAVLPRVDVLLANILAQPLIELAALFQTLLRPGGHLVLSGILAEQADAVAAAYASGFELQWSLLRDDWVRLHSVRR